MKLVTMGRIGSWILVNSGRYKINKIEIVGGRTDPTNRGSTTGKSVKAYLQSHWRDATYKCSDLPDLHTGGTNNSPKTNSVTCNGAMSSYSTRYVTLYKSGKDSFTICDIKIQVQRWSMDSGTVPMIATLRNKYPLVAERTMSADVWRDDGTSVGFVLRASENKNNENN